MTIRTSEIDLTLRTPRLRDGAAIWQLVQCTQPLDINSCYTYLLLSSHFASTSVVALHRNDLVGFITGYRLPEASDVLFVWQVGVTSAWRGQGIAGAMLRHLLDRDTCRDVRFLEATITPTNTPSKALFRALARERNVPCQELAGFAPQDFGTEAHEAEQLFRIGPLW
ncbi:MAG: hypothetical protein ETSY1_33495 [Candidatus Entotheonella factor]|uniref:L-2,4-diaminobutyric acid acetyltransferase n=1 Tax=Entotheonella factor TaxID=1429438 RepID=W4LA21_ENTF1|nr:diaminobutyrate acetyltransferase [Candidatus Entotheonella palauensis]ETW94759.1 MAG: hypothetical protein ETSY1_33495 [Candidatus Entotheonella factor]